MSDWEVLRCVLRAMHARAKPNWWGTQRDFVREILEAGVAELDRIIDGTGPTPTSATTEAP